MTEKEFARVANEAINAAQKVVHDAGIGDKVVVQLGFANADQVKSGNKDFAIELVHSCKCWDCVNTDGGRCICCGPACDC